MKPFHQQLLTRSQPIWDRILSHRFLEMTAAGKIPEQTFKTLMQQDYIFVREAIPFVAVLLAKAPMNLRSNLIQVLSGLDQELGLFRKNAERHGVELAHVEPAPTCHSYLQFLMNAAYNSTFEEGFAVLYSAEKIYLDSWMTVKNNLQGKSPWQEFIENWTSQGFQTYVDWLGVTLDELVAGKPENDLQKIEKLFVLTARYEFMFWEMAAIEETWKV